MPTHRISVTVEADVIEGDGPFGNGRLDHAAGVGGQKPRVKGRFKYTVVSEENPGLRLDPVIIVDPPPTSGAE